MGALPGNGAGREMWGKGELCVGQAKCVVPGGQPGRGAVTQPAATAQTHSSCPCPQSHLTSAQAKVPRVTLDFLSQPAPHPSAKRNGSACTVHLEPGQPGRHPEVNPHHLPPGPSVPAFLFTPNSSFSTQQPEGLYQDPGQPGSLLCAEPRRCLPIPCRIQVTPLQWRTRLHVLAPAPVPRLCCFGHTGRPAEPRTPSSAWNALLSALAWPVPACPAQWSLPSTAQHLAWRGTPPRGTSAPGGGFMLFADVSPGPGTVAGR